jgi:hypothetical protein
MSRQQLRKEMEDRLLSSGVSSSFASPAGGKL